MRAYVLDEIGQLNDREYPLRALKSGEALVKIQAAGICGSDIPRIFETGTYHFPTIPGHEFAGTVVEVASDASDEEKAWIGKHVGVFPLVPCKECTMCRQKKYEMCSHYDYLGSRSDGGFAEYCIVPVWNLLEIPDGVTMEEAAMLEPASVALHAVRRVYNVSRSTDRFGSVSSGDQGDTYKVLVLGLGTIAGILTQYLSLLGIKYVTATGHHGEQEELMHRYANASYRFVDTTGVDDVTSILGEDAYDVIFDCINTTQSWTDALSLVKAGGKIVMVGNPHGNLELPKAVHWKVLRKQVTLVGTWNSSFTHDQMDDWNLVLFLLEKGMLQLKPLITHSLEWEELQKGLEIMRTKHEFYNKIMIVNKQHE